MRYAHCTECGDRYSLNELEWVNGWLFCPDCYEIKFTLLGKDNEPSTEGNDLQLEDGEDKDSGESNPESAEVSTVD